MTSAIRHQMSCNHNEKMATVTLHARAQSMILYLLHSISIQRAVLDLLRQLYLLVKLITLTIEISFRKTSAAIVGGLVIVHRLLSLLKNDFKIHCKYRPPLKNMLGQCSF